MINFDKWDSLIGKFHVVSWDYLIDFQLIRQCELFRNCAIKLPIFNNLVQQLRLEYEIEWHDLHDQLFGAIDDKIPEQIDKIDDQAAEQEPTHQLGIQEFLYIPPECLVKYIVLASVLSYAYNQQMLEALQFIVNNCGWILPFEKICILCDRPTKLSFDNENRLHAEGEPAISFADGYSLYSYHGVTLPEKYGKLHPKEWQAKWLLEETNAELRRVLIQGIGYSRICQDLQAIELDCWQEYTLLKIDSNIDIEAIYLLKMTCPSTGFIHALRVPPDMNCARDAICWVNWGIDPEEFSVQT